MADQDRILHFRTAAAQRGEKPRAINYRMAAKTKDTAEVYLYDSIGGWGISAKQFATDLKALGSPKTIDMHVNSEGGDVFEGRAIYTSLANSSARIIAHVDGIAASVASLICMAAAEIRMADGAFMMVHNAWSFTIGNAADHQKMMDLLNSVDSSMRETYAARTGQTQADVKTWCDAETWMNATEAVARGFADVKDEPVKVAACIRDPSRFHHLPSALRPNRLAAAAMLASMPSAGTR